MTLFVWKVPAKKKLLHAGMINHLIFDPDFTNYPKPIWDNGCQLTGRSTES
jgi:hypothetical protein